MSETILGIKATEDAAPVSALNARALAGSADVKGPGVVVPRAPAAPSSEDQLPTSRLQSIPPPLPPPLAPQGPAHKTQPLRALTPGAADAELARANRRPWRALVGQVKRAATAVPARFPALGLAPAAWTQRRIGVSCALLGLTMVVGSVVLGWVSVATARLETIEHASLAIAIVLARAAIALAAMFVGYAIMRIGERLAFPAPSERADKRANATQG